MWIKLTADRQRTHLLKNVSFPKQNKEITNGLS